MKKMTEDQIPEEYEDYMDLEIEDEENPSVLEREITRIVDKALRDRLVDLAIDDVRLIVKEMMPNIDRMISERVKTHFYEIGSFLVEKFGNIEEGE
jgi:hypothetical protein